MVHKLQQCSLHLLWEVAYIYYPFPVARVYSLRRRPEG